MNEQSKKFERAKRLLAPPQFEYVFNEAIPVSSQHFIMLARFNTLTHPRLGITVAKKKVKLAVQRNRIKRLVRENFRSRCMYLPNIDIIVMAKNGISDKDNIELAVQLKHLWKRLNKRCQKSKSPNS